MPFLRCTEEHDYTVVVAEIVALSVDVSSSSLLAAGLHLVEFKTLFDWLHVSSHINSWVKEAIFERQLRTRSDSCCFINWNFSMSMQFLPLLGQTCSLSSQIDRVLMSVHGYYSRRRLL